MFISNREKESIKRDSANIWNNINTLYEGKRQMNNLFAKDRHGTVRPKVDMLADRINNSEINFWNALNDLQNRIKKLERK